MRSSLSKINTPSTRRWLHWSVFSLVLLDVRSGLIIFRVSGPKVNESFKHEAGGHRWQRISPTEKRGRVHTSTITVAVLEEPKEHEIYISKDDLEESFTRGSGAGGQHRNKTDTAVILKHIPSGIQVRVEVHKSQHKNREEALSILRTRLKAAQKEGSKKARDECRKGQVGSGMRGDKIRTIQVRNNLVIDHRTDKRMSYDKYVKGKLKEIR